MLLQTDPSLAEVPGFSREQLEALASNVEQRRQQLEREINAYVQRQQAALRRHEQELVNQYRSSSMECDAKSEADSPPSRTAGSVDTTPEPQPERAPPEEKAKRTKHTRVHKREKELYGLVTPVFLPLLDAHDTSPVKPKDKKPQVHQQSRPDDAATATATATATASPSRDGDKTAKDARKSRTEASDMDMAAHGPTAKDQPDDAVKKLKRAVAKKSAMRHSHRDSDRTRRKRVSLVIDGQTVLPADSVIESALPSPSPSTEATSASSASNSTASLDDMIDPRLTRPDPSVHLSQNHAVHHSLPLTMSRYTHAHPPSIPLSQPTTSAPAPAPISPAATSPPAQLASPRSPNILFPAGPAPQSLPRTFLDPSPVHPASLPDTDIALDPTTSELDAQDLASDDNEHDEHQWHTYVGGLHGSGVDDVDQAGSYGYPSSLGASYLESYMQNRPLSVRMVAADKAGLSERDKRGMREEARIEEQEDEEFGRSIPGRGRDDDDEMDIVGSMEGF
ncbi:hypothetical protein NX059_000202 [Plenodomus lindquistii]|nr:hypothetical protein NX059_000202 [Plenodomus lindquistii]